MLSVVSGVIAFVAALVLLGILTRAIISLLGDDGGPDTFGFGAAMSLLMALAIVCVPLGVWKLAEILLWLYRHLHWSWS